jgi:hypothetical protein
VPTPALLEDRRCRRGERCVRRDRHTTTTCGCRCHLGGAFPTCDQPTGCGDTHTEASETVIYVGALLEEPAAGFCGGCVPKLELALSELPKLYVQLTLLHLPSMTVVYRLDDITGGEATGPPIPLNEYIEALTSKIEHEASTWAEVVADTAGVAWDSQVAGASRPGHRMQRACQLLGYRIAEWLRAGTHEYPARSVTADPLHGHDEDTTTRYGRDWWCHRDGPAAALDVLSLHAQAIRATGGAPADREPVPCRYCGERELRREHEACVVVCRSCGDRQSDDAYDEVRDQFFALALAMAADTDAVAAAA